MGKGPEGALIVLQGRILCTVFKHGGVLILTKDSGPFLKTERVQMSLGVQNLKGHSVRQSQVWGFNFFPTRALTLHNMYALVSNLTFSRIQPLWLWSPGPRPHLSLSSYCSKWEPHHITREPLWLSQLVLQLLVYLSLLFIIFFQCINYT